MSSASGLKMEDILRQLARDIITPKFSNIKHTALTALDLLEDEDKLQRIEPWELREICLQPLQLALESRARKLGHTALAGIQVMFKDERFRSSMETSEEDKWLPSQVLTVLAVAHSLAEDLQIEVMKLLLNMTVTASWCTSAKTIIKIAQILLALHSRSRGHRDATRSRACLLAVFALFSCPDRSKIDSQLEKQLLEVLSADSAKHVYIGSYQNCVMVQGAVQAAFVTMINKFVGGLVEMQESAQVDDGDDVLADFKSNSQGASTENLISEVVLILTFLTDRLEAVASTSQGKQTLPLLLEGVSTILSKVPPSIRHNYGFQELLWKRLCPCLISLLGEPKAEKVTGQKSGHPDVQKSTGISTSGPNITQASAKVIYNIAGELASLVGSIPPLRPVLESLFHKILMFPIPQNRHDALRVLKELMSEPQKVVSLVGSNNSQLRDKNVDTNLSLIKMLVDSVQQSSHVSDSAIVYTSVSCIDGLLASLDRIRQGEAIPDNMLKPQKGTRGHTRRSMTSNPDDDGGSEFACEAYDDAEDPITESPAGDVKTDQEISSTDQSEEPKESKKSPHQSPSRAQFEAEEKENARQFICCLRQVVPELTNAMSIWEVDESLQQLSAQFCANLPQNQLGLRSQRSLTGVVLNSDGVYVAAISALKLNLRLINTGYYVNKKNVPITESDFLNEMFSSGLLLYLPPAWLKEVYTQVLSSSLLSTGVGSPSSGVGRSSSPLINYLQDLEGVGTTEERGRLMSDFREVPSAMDGDDVDKGQRVEAGKSLAAAVLSACWAQVLDILSVTLNEQVPIGGAGGMTRYSLSLLLATDSAQEDVRRARSAICTSLNGLQRAAKLCCVLGLQQLCGSAFSQLARTSCMKEDFRAVAVTESKGQSKTSVLSSNKPKLIKLHAAHVLSMDVVMTTGLEMGSHSADCWKHVFRCCAHISELEHMYFSQGNNQSSLPKVTHGAQGSGGQDKEGAEADGSCDTDLYSSQVATAVPVAPRINVPHLIQQSGLESGWDNSLAAGGVLTFAQASKALCGLSQEVDSLFEGAADKLCLDALLHFVAELGEATLIQLQKLGSGGNGMMVGGSGVPGVGTRPPTNALHLYRLQQVLIQVVNSSRPLLHLLRVWSAVSPYLVQATGNPDHVISKMAVTSIHEFIVSLVSQREERPFFHVNEFVCKTFEDMLCLELCDGDVQDQIVCCICELVEACCSQLQSGWRPLFGALRSVKIEYTTNEAVNEARQRHVAAVMDVFDVYLGMDNIAVFASATVDCVLCLLKYVHGPATFDSDMSESRSDSLSDDDLEYDDGKGELESLCVPALKYLTLVCEILASMWQMPACPVFKGAHRIQVDTASRLVDGEIPSMNFKLFAEEFSLDKYKRPMSAGLSNSGDNNNADQDTLQNKFSNSDAEPTALDHREQKTPPEAISISSQIPTSTDSPVTTQESALDDNKDNSEVEEVKVESQEVSDSEVPDADVSHPAETVDCGSGTQNVETLGENAKDPNEDHSVDLKISSNDLSQKMTTRPADLSGLDRCHEQEVISDPVYEMNDFVSVEKIVQMASYKSLDDMDNESGVLHVWFLLLDGLVSAINHCPKAFQSSALTTLIDLLKSAAQGPGPEFSMHCMNHLLLPMLQSWLRRGSRCYGYWNTGIISFKQCCGLVADLVVDFATKFSNKPDLDGPLQLCLKQTYDVFIECVAQPVENISRLGCSCIRHIILSAGPHLSEPLWQIAALAVRRALSVTTYNLQLLMALFHPNSDNFYGDIGQVKVATRKDCTVVDCLRLRQMAKQVFLLDSQISSMPNVQYDTDQDKSFVFLLYPPGHQDSLNPDHISTRVPFRHVVVGLLSNQLLLQTVGSILLEHSENQKDSSRHTGLPGLMSHMSTRNIHQFLSALEDVFRVAHEFDARPGLKFLLQKVACLDMAANLYKQAATAILFHVHSLVEICAHLDNSSITSTKAAITPVAETTQTPGVLPSIADVKQMASISLAKPWTNGKLFLQMLQNMCEELCQTYMEVLHDAGKGSLLDKMSEKPIFFLTAQHDDISQITASAQLNFQKSKSLEQQRSKSVDSQRSKSVEVESHPEVEGIGLTVAVTTPQTQDESDDDLTEDEEEKRDNEEGSDEDDHRQRSKREIREDLQSKVYTVATDQVIENLMSQYKRHKHQRSMPNFVRVPKFQRAKFKIPRKEMVDDVIDKQQKSSLMKDSEAHIQAWSDSLTAILQMIMNLPDSSFSALLPVTFTFVNQLILHASDSTLRDQLAQCFTRLGRMYDFAPYSVTSSQAQSPPDLPSFQRQKSA